MKKKILFIIWSYTYGGGAEALLTVIVNHLNPEKYDISIIEYEHAETKIEKVNDNIHILPYIQAVQTEEKYSKTYQLYHSPEVLIRTYIKKEFDLYVSFNYLIPTFLLPKGTKNISWIHGDVYNLADQNLLRERIRQNNAFGNVEKIVAISDFTEQSLEELFPEHKDKLVKIYNGIDIDKVKKESMEQTNIRIHKPAIVFIGRLEENKNPVRLIHILRLVHDKGLNIHLYYLGEGKLKESIYEEAFKNNLLEYVHCLGYHQNPFPIIKQCDITCLLSKQEGFSMSLLESIALGVPFVATKVGGATELSNKERCGRIIESDEDAQKAILSLLKIEKSSVRRECEKSIQRFNIKRYIAQIEDLFDSVIN